MDDIQGNNAVNAGQGISEGARSALLVVASVVAAASLQVAAQPPGGTDDKSYKSALAVKSQGGYLGFLYVNGIAICSAINLLIDLTDDLPMQTHVYYALTSILLVVEYSTLVLAPDDMSGKAVIFALVLPALTVVVLRFIPKLYRKYKA